jgi:hypothetical protein
VPGAGLYGPRRYLRQGPVSPALPPALGGAGGIGGHIAEDYSENNDLAMKVPDKMREMQKLFYDEADGKARRL